jgi:cyclase
MPHKRLIFILLYDSGNFMLSRNFRLQRVGDINWLIKNYNFKNIAHSIDELIVLDVTRKDRSIAIFSEMLKKLVTHVFVPIAAGGGVHSLESAALLLRSGADKLVINSILHTDGNIINELSRTFGSQCIVTSIDFKRNNNGDFVIYYDKGQKPVDISLKDAVRKAVDLGSGEILINSIDKDGTGNGYELAAVDIVRDSLEVPLIISGGAGNARHLIEGIKTTGVDAVATANLFNFVGNGLPLARTEMLSNGLDLAIWDLEEFEVLQDLKG